jgi:hypothetical protein
MAFIISPQPVALTVVPGQDSTFTVSGSTDNLPLSSYTYNYQWYVDNVLVSGATSSSYTFDPLIGDSGKSFKATVTVLSGTTLPLNTLVTVLTSNAVTLTVNEDAPPYDVYDLGTETGRQRHARLRLLGYI